MPLTNMILLSLLIDELRLHLPLCYPRYLAKMYLGEAYFKYGQLEKAHAALFQENACDVNFFVSQDSDERKDDGGSECNWPGQASSVANSTIKPINGENLKCFLNSDLHLRSNIDLFTFSRMVPQ